MGKSPRRALDLHSPAHFAQNFSQFAAGAMLHNTRACDKSQRAQVAANFLFGLLTDTHRPPVAVDPQVGEWSEADSGLDI